MLHSGHLIISDPGLHDIGFGWEIWPLINRANIINIVLLDYINWTSMYIHPNYKHTCPKGKMWAEQFLNCCQKWTNNIIVGGGGVGHIGLWHHETIFLCLRTFLVIRDIPMNPKIPKKSFCCRFVHVKPSIPWTSLLGPV